MKGAGSRPPHSTSEPDFERHATFTRPADAALVLAENGRAETAVQVPLIGEVGSEKGQLPALALWLEDHPGVEQAERFLIELTLASHQTLQLRVGRVAADVV